MSLNKPKIAVVGAGITGLGAAHELAKWAEVTVFEQDHRIGGHSHAVNITLDGIEHPVDTGFLVFNDRTYPNMLKLFTQLNVPIAQSNMSFSVSLGPYDYEWAGSDDITQVLAQPSNIVKPRFWFMVKDMLRFNRAATALAQSDELDNNQTCNALSLGQYLDQNNYSQAFRNDYLLPMAAAIWSCPMQQILAFPLHTFIRFCDNHGLLQVNNRPQWKTIAGSSREYVKRLTQSIVAQGGVIHDGHLVSNVHSLANGQISLSAGQKDLVFDAVLMAGHSDQSLKALAVPSIAQASVLKAIRYQPNRAVLHTDLQLMPRRKRAWAAWNYMGKGQSAEALSVTYWLNRLQPLPFKTPIFVTLNPVIEPDPNQVIREFSYAHPIFDQGAIAAQSKLASIQGEGNIWFAGAWAGYGFHEDGLKSGQTAAALIQSFWLEQTNPLARNAA